MVGDHLTVRSNPFALSGFRGLVAGFDAKVFRQLTNSGTGNRPESWALSVG